MTKIYWAVVNVQTTTQNDMIDVVKTANWVCQAADEHWLFSESGTVSLDDPGVDTFVPFADLRQQIVLDWVFAYIDKAAVEARLIAKVAAQYAPPLEIKTIPE